MIDYTKLPYTERLLYISLLQKQSSTAAALTGATIEQPLHAEVRPATLLQSGGRVPPAPTTAGGVSLENLLCYGLLAAGATLLVYGLYEHFASSPKIQVYRKQEEPQGVH